MFAYITPDIDLNGRIVGYTSFRKKPPRSAIEKIEPIYQKLVEAERQGGMSASYELLKELLDANDENVIEKYRKLVFDLQKG